MSAAGRGATSGVIMGLAAVLLLQQFGYVDLSALVPTAEILVASMVVGGLLFGFIGWRAGVRYERRHPTGAMPEWKPGSGAT